MSEPLAKKPVKPSAGTVFDVSRPGRSPATATSKPIIVGHKPQVRDPFTTGRPSDDRPLLSAKQKVLVEPSDEAPATPAVGSDLPVVSGAASAELAAIAAELAASPEIQSDKPKPVPEPASPGPKPEPSTPEPATHDEPNLASAPITGPKDAEAAPVKMSGTELPPETVVVVKSAPLSPELKKEMEDAVHDSPSAAEPKGVIVSGGHGSLKVWRMLTWSLAVIALVMVVGDVLLDANVITTKANIPHTNLIK